MCFMNLSRVYLFIRVLRDWLVSDLPKRHTVTGLAQVKTSPIPVSNRTPVLRTLHPASTHAAVVVAAPRDEELKSRVPVRTHGSESSCYHVLMRTRTDHGRVLMTESCPDAHTRILTSTHMDGILL